MDFRFTATLDRVHEFEPRLSSMHPSDSYSYDSRIHGMLSVRHILGSRKDAGVALGARNITMIFGKESL